MKFLQKSLFISLFISVIFGITGCGSDDEVKEDQLTVKTVEIK